MFRKLVADLDVLLHGRLHGLGVETLELRIAQRLEVVFRTLAVRHRGAKKLS